MGRLKKVRNANGEVRIVFGWRAIMFQIDRSDGSYFGCAFHSALQLYSYDMFMFSTFFEIVYLEFQIEIKAFSVYSNDGVDENKILTSDPCSESLAR